MWSVVWKRTGRGFVKEIILLHPDSTKWIEYYHSSSPRRQRCRSQICKTLTASTQTSSGLMVHAATRSFSSKCTQMSPENSNHTVPQFHKYVSKIMVQVPTRTPRIMESRRRRVFIIETRLLIPGILSERRSELDIENLTGNTYSWLWPLWRLLWRALFFDVQIPNAFHRLGC